MNKVKENLNLLNISPPAGLDGSSAGQPTGQTAGWNLFHMWYRR